MTLEHKNRQNEIHAIDEMSHAKEKLEYSNAQFESSFTNIESWIKKESLSQTEATNPEDIVDFIVNSAESNSDVMTRDKRRIVEVCKRITHPTERMTEDMEQELERLQRKPQEDLTADEKELIDVLTILNEIAPYINDDTRDDEERPEGGGSEPKKTLDPKVKETIQGKIKYNDIKLDNLSELERDFVYKLRDEDFMGTGKSAKELLEKANYEAKNIDKDFINKVLNSGQALENDLEYNSSDVALELKKLALAISYVKDTARVRLQTQEELLDASLDNIGMMPKQKITKQVKNSLRKVRYGLEREFAKNPNKGVIALGGGLLLVGMLLTSDNAKAQGLRKMILGGSAAVLGLMGLDFVSGAVLNEPLSKKIEKATRFGGQHVSNNIKTLLWNHTEGATEKEKESELESFSVMTGMLDSTDFAELWDKYEAAERSGSHAIHISGINEEGIFPGQKTSEAFYKGMKVFANRYGEEITQLKNENGAIPVGAFTMMEVVLSLVTHDKNHPGPDAEPFKWMWNRAGHAIGSAMLHGRKLSYNVTEAASKAVGKKRDFIQEFRGMFPENEYGEIKFLTTEEIVVLPGGLRVPYRLSTRTKNQSEQPAEQKNQIQLINPHLEGGKEGKVINYSLGEGNKGKVYDFMKGLIVASATKLSPEHQDNPEAKALMEGFDKYENRLYFNKVAHAWAITDLQLGKETYTIAGEEFEAEDTVQDVLINFFAADKGTVGMNFYSSKKEFTSGDNERLDLNRFIDESKQTAFKEQLLKGAPASFPFDADDIRVENWQEIRDGETDTVEAVLTSGNSVQLRVDKVNGVLAFDFASSVENKDKISAVKHKVEKDIDEIKDLTSDLDESIMERIRGIVTLDLGRSVNDAEFNELLEAKKESLIKRLTNQSEDGSYEYLNDETARAQEIKNEIGKIAELREDIVTHLSKDEALDSKDYRKLSDSLTSIGLSKAGEREYRYLNAKLDDEINFESEKARVEMLSLFTDLISDAEEIDNVEKRSIYISYISQNLLSDAFGGENHKALRRLNSVEVSDMGTKIENERSNAALNSTVRKFPTAQQFEAEMETYEVATAIKLMERIWSDDIERLAEVGDALGLQGSLAEFLEPKVEHEISTTLVTPPLTIDKENTIHLDLPTSPFLADVIDLATSPGDWNLLRVPFDIMGADLEQLLSKIPYPKFRDGKAVLKQRLSVETNKFIQQNKARLKNSNKEALKKEYSAMVTQLWIEHLDPSLIGEEDSSSQVARGKSSRRSNSRRSSGSGTVTPVTRESKRPKTRKMVGEAPQKKNNTETKEKHEAVNEKSQENAALKAKLEKSFVTDMEQKPGKKEVKVLALIPSPNAANPERSYATVKYSHIDENGSTVQKRTKYMYEKQGIENKLDDSYDFKIDED